MGVVIAQSRNKVVARTHGWKRLQFSLRAILILTMLFAVYISYLVRQEANRNQLVREIENAGGNVTIDKSLFSIFPTERITDVTVAHGRIKEIGASRLKTLPKLTTLSLTDVDMVNDDGLRIKASAVRFTRITSDLLESIDSASNTTQSR